MARNKFDHEQIANWRANGLKWAEIAEKLGVQKWVTVYNAHYSYNRRLEERSMARGKTTPRSSGVFSSLGMSSGSKRREDTAMAFWEEDKERSRWSESQWDLIEGMALALEEANIWNWEKEKGSKPTRAPSPTADDLVMAAYGDPDQLQGDVKQTAIILQTRLLGAALRVAKGRYRFVSVGGVRGNKTRAGALELSRQERTRLRDEGGEEAIR